MTYSDYLMLGYGAFFVILGGFLTFSWLQASSNQQE